MRSDQLILKEEAAVLTEARKVLDTVAKRLGSLSISITTDLDQAYNLGVMKNAVEHGEKGVFEALNCLSAYGDSTVATQVLGTALAGKGA